jgi:exosortase family protein XrtF
MSIIKENREAILFLLTFIALYFLLNSLYGLYINFYYPSPDPFTRFIADQVVGVLSLIGFPVVSALQPESNFIPLMENGKTVINFFEGCNSLNVIIIYGSFLVAFRDKVKRLIPFLLVGALGIYIINILRVVMLYVVAIEFPQYMYFFHKYLFTAFIYFFVFLLWFYWVRGIRHEGK